MRNTKFHIPHSMLFLGVNSRTARWATLSFSALSDCSAISQKWAVCQMFRILIVFLALAHPAYAQSAKELAFVKSLMINLQERSFDANREFCGTIGIDEDGALVSSKPRRGWRSSCRPRDSRDAVEIISSFHTHGAFTTKSDSEVPSVNDVEADMSEGTNGWVATPGGRLWFINGQTGFAQMVCGLGCLPQDPDFEAGWSGPIPRSFTLEQLRDFFGE